MISLSGLTVKSDAYPGGDIDIIVTGMRPGEKLYEELLIGDNPQPTQHPRIMKAQEQCLPWSAMADKIALLDAVLGLNDVAMLRKMLADLVAGYRPAEDIVDWLHLEYMAELAEVSPAGLASMELRQVV
jgi:FlaA1/EpsC-like NDP-sugar epimerase